MMRTSTHDISHPILLVLVLVLVVVLALSLVLFTAYETIISHISVFVIYFYLNYFVSLSRLH